jgi:hypothetical protein
MYVCKLTFTRWTNANMKIKLCNLTSHLGIQARAPMLNAQAGFEPITEPTPEAGLPYVL